jgi:hypothetical protein
MEVLEKIAGVMLVVTLILSGIYYKQWRFEKRYKEL